MGELVSLSDYREARERAENDHLKKRIADLAIEISLLESERQALRRRLFGALPEEFKAIPDPCD